MLLARTTPRDRCARSTDGLTLFYTGLDPDFIEVREIAKMGRAAVDSNTIFIDCLPAPEDHRIGEKGERFRYLLHGLNPERILIGMEGIGIGQDALKVLARALAVELAPDSVTVNCVAPGLIRKDEGRQSVLTPEQWRALCAKVPVGRLGEPDEVAAVIEFLAGPDSGYVTGQVCHVNGGLL